MQKLATYKTVNIGRQMRPFELLQSTLPPLHQPYTALTWTEVVETNNYRKLLQIAQTFLTDFRIDLKPRLNITEARMDVSEHALNKWWMYLILKYDQSPPEFVAIAYVEDMMKLSKHLLGFIIAVVAGLPDGEIGEWSKETLQRRLTEYKILCAGIARFSETDIYIDNLSGTFQPTDGSLLLAERMMTTAFGLPVRAFSRTTLESSEPLPHEWSLVPRHPDYKEIMDERMG